jgi:hypothetical protein
LPMAHCHPASLLTSATDSCSEINVNGVGI